MQSIYVSLNPDYTTKATTENKTYRNAANSAAYIPPLQLSLLPILYLSYQTTIALPLSSPH